MSSNSTETSVSTFDEVVYNGGLMWSPPAESCCTHDLPNPADNKMCVFRCGKCGCLFESQVDGLGISLFGWYWKERSDRWFKRKLKRGYKAEKKMLKGHDKKFA